MAGHGADATFRGAFPKHVFWLISRAPGIVTLLAASGSVGVGLRRRELDLRSIHEALSLAAMAAIVVHAGARV